MLSPSDVITANEQRVAAKVMEGEAILINLMTGAYYSTAVDRWLHLVSHRKTPFNQRNGSRRHGTLRCRATAS